MMKRLKTICLLLCICLFPLSVSAERVIKEVVVFSDSLSDSNGDDFHDSDTALSTYNLLRTLRGDEVDVKGVKQRPLDLGQLLSARMTVDNLKAGLQRYHREMAAERAEETHFLLKLKSLIQEGGVQFLTKVLIAALDAFEHVHDFGNDLILGPLETLSKKLAEHAAESDDDEHRRELLSLNHKIKVIRGLANANFAQATLEVTEEVVLSISEKFAGMIPDIPSSFYERGKWTAGREYDLMWPQALVRMMAIPGDPATPVKLRNMSMAGSWVLSTSNKIDQIDDLLATADGPTELVTMMFQGSLVPPCLEQIVNCYLSEERLRFTDLHKRTPKEGEHYLSSENLYIVFHGANDFLNNWNDPDQVARELSYEVEDLMIAGAQTIVVVLLPDISVTPRYQSPAMQDEGLSIKDKIQIFNTSLTIRLNLLRAEHKYECNGLDESKPCLVTIDAQQIFDELRRSAEFDPLHPLLKVAIPGVDKQTKDNPGATAQEQAELDRIRAGKLDEAKAQNNWVMVRLLENKAYADYWIMQAGESDEVDPGKVALFADTVHLSGEGHDKLARIMCTKASQEHGLSCNPDKFPPETAKAECAIRRGAVVAQ
ncbi:SGNH/GDSL hydrolase family protein [Spongorhabdus nitratireducens]